MLMTMVIIRLIIVVKIIKKGACDSDQDQENFCPLTIAVDNSPCFNSHSN